MPHPLLDAIQRADRSAVAALLTDGVRFHSPATAEPTVGAELVAHVLTTAGQVYQDLVVEQVLTQGPAEAVFFRAQVEGQALEVCYRLEVDGDGRIVRLAALMRPVAAAEALVQAMMRRLGGS